jgi:hypothetical protein
MAEAIELAPDKDATPKETQGENNFATGTEVGDRRAMDVNVVQTTGSTEYTEGDVDATITGTALMFEADEGTNTLETVNLSNPLPVTLTQAANLIDSGNSSATPLGISGVFTGTGFDVSSYQSVSIHIFADENSATDGMSFQFSADNVNWDDQNDYNLDIAESNTRRFQFPTTAQYFRVVYTNGAIAQTAFRLQTIYHVTNIMNTIHRVDESLENDRSVSVVKAVITGETTAGGGAFVNVKVNPSGTLEANVTQDTADDLLTNANIQVGDVDASTANPVPVNNSHAQGDTVGATDRGVALLAEHREDQIHTANADGEYDVLSVDSLGSLHVNAEAHHIWDQLDATTGWAAVDTDTENLATSTNHILGSAALTFDKANTGANNTAAMIEKTVTTVDMGDVSPHDIFQTPIYLSDTSNVDYVFCRLGTDSSNYNEWRIAGENLTQGEWEILAFVVGDASFIGNTGNGWDQTAISYVALGVNFDLESRTLTGIQFDQFSYHTNQHTTTSINAEVSSSVSSPNVKVNGWAGSVSTNDGVATNGTLRVTQANDVTVNVAASSLPLPSGAATAANQLPDGHNVTVDNAAGASAVNIQDGGNSITVDDGGSSLTVDGTVTVNQPVDVKGEVAEGAAISGTDPVIFAGKDISGNALVPTMLTAAGLGVFGVLPVDAAGNTIDISSSGEYYVQAFSTDQTVANADYAVIDASGNQLVVGNVAHDAVDSGNPVKIGGKAVSDVYAETSVAEDDRTNANFSLIGQQHVLNYGYVSGAVAQTALEDTYDNVTTTASGADIEPDGFRTGVVLIDLESANTPTRIQILLEIKSSSGTYHEPGSGYWQAVEWEDTLLTSGFEPHINFKVPETSFRFSVTATGTDASNTFTINDFEVHMRT